MRSAVSSTDQAAWAYYLLAVTCGLSVGLLLVPAVRPTVRLPVQDWMCTAWRPEQRAISTANGPTMETVYACDQWSRR